MSSKPSLLSLPNELLDIIFHDPVFEDDIFSLLQLSRCCKYLRTLLVPQVFRCITFTDDFASCISALKAAQAHPQHVRSLHFTGRTLPYSWPEEYLSSDDELVERRMIKDPDLVLHWSARSLLSGLYTPHVTSLRICFEVAVWQFETCHKYYYKDRAVWEAVGASIEWQDEKDESLVWEYEMESRYLWLARVAAIWRSIAANTRLTHLQVDNLFARSTSVFHEPGWTRFANQLEGLEIGTPLGQADGVDDSELTLFHGGYSTGRLGTRQWMAFTDAQKLRHLELRGSAMDGVGHSLKNTLGKKPWNFPRLTSLHLYTIFINSRLGLWLAHHARVLRNLEMYNCWTEEAYGSFTASWTQGTWKNVFGPYADADTGSRGPVHLRKLVVYAGDCEDVSTYIPLHTPQREEWPWHLEAADNAPGYRHNRPHGGPFDMTGKRIGPPHCFLYGDIGISTSDYGGWGSHVDPRPTVEAWEKGEDWKEYERLVAIVDRNNAADRAACA